MFFFFSLIIVLKSFQFLQFLYNFFDLITEVVISMLSKEPEIEIDPVITEAKIRKCSI